MSFFASFRSRKSSPDIQRGKSRPAPAWRPSLLSLEDRCVPATLQVTSPLDDGSAPTLRYAVTHAHNGDKIVLKGVALGGITLTHGELRLSQTNLTIQTQSDQDDATISGGGLSRVFEVAGGADVTLKDLTITGGNAQVGNPDDTYEGRGGGIVVDVGGALTVAGSTVTNNFAPPIPNDDPASPFKGGLGGGIADYGSLTIKNCSVTNNQADYTFGGGIAVFSGDPFSAINTATLTVKDSTISGNVAQEDGGGICGVASTITLDNCDVTGNSTVLLNGGGINNHGGAMTVSHSVVSNNTAYALGGGIQSFAGSTLTLIDCDVTGNSSGYSGAGIDNGGLLTIRDSRLLNNTTQMYDWGGGLYNRPSGFATLKHDVFSQNWAEDGGAIAAYGTVVISDCQLSNNTANSDGGAIFNLGSMDIDHSDLTQNTAFFGGAIESDLTMTIRHSAISDNTAGWVGGAINAHTGSLTITDSELSRNAAGGYAGAIEYDNGSLTVTNSDLVGNTAGYGGALRATSCTGAVTNCNLTGNMATYDGGAVEMEFAAITLSGSQVTGNSANRGGGIFNSFGPLTISSSTISGNTAISDGGGLYDTFATVILNHSSKIVGNTAPAGFGGDVYLADSFSALYLQSHSQLGDVFNLGALYKDSGSHVDHVDGNAFIPI